MTTARREEPPAARVGPRAAASRLVDDRWRRHRHVPGIDAVTFADGTVVVLSCYADEQGRRYARPLCDTSVESLLRYEEDLWTEVQTFVRVVDESTGLVYLGGEGGMGNEGFVACTDAAGALAWCAFFEGSNPFVEIDVRTQHVVARSTAGAAYGLDKLAPERIVIG